MEDRALLSALLVTNTPSTPSIWDPGSDTLAVPGDLADAPLLHLEPHAPSTQFGALETATDVDAFRLDLEATGRLTATLKAQGGRTRLSLLDDQGHLLVQSDGRSPVDPDDRIVQHLVPGTYYLRIEGRAGGSGPYALTTEVVAANAPFALAPTESPPNSPFIRDVSGDGRADLVTSVMGEYDPVTSQYVGGGVEVMLGLGDGTFGPSAFIPAGKSPWLADVVDVDGDGHDDLVILDRGDRDLQSYQYFNPSVVVLLGAGDGTFRPLAARTRIPGLYSESVSLGDVDGDGRLDLVVANAGGFDSQTSQYTDLGVSLFLGVGDGTFRPSARFSIRGDPTSADLGDVNGDGRLDLLVAHDEFDEQSGMWNGEAGVDVFLGGGDGTFRPHGFLTGTGPASMALADVDSDGHLDVVTLGGPGGAAYLGRGDGTFSSPISYFAGYGDRGLAIGDVDGDGRPDLVTCPLFAGVSVLIGGGDGTFRPPAPVEIEGERLGASLGDVDGDGRLDLIVADPGAGDPQTGGYVGAGVAVLLNPGDGTFHSRSRYAVGSLPWTVAVGDVDRDGWPDVITANWDSSSVSVLRGVGDGTFRPAADFPAGIPPSFVAVGDFNNDGRLDLVTCDGFVSISVLLGLGDGTFGPPVLYEVGGGPQTVAVGDVNGDGRLDLVAENGEFGDPDLAGVAVLLGRGDGTFGPPTRFTFRNPLSFGDNTPVFIHDVNGDGRPDLVTTGGEVLDHDGGYVVVVVQVLLGFGDGTFGPPTRFEAGPSPLLLALGDVNGDGRLDAVAASADLSGEAPATVLTELLGRGDGTFGPPASIATEAYYPGSLALVDANGDGRPDLLVTDQSEDGVEVHLNEGDGLFGPPTHFTVGNNPTSIALFDANGDGRLDLATANSGSGDVSVLLGLGDGTFVDSSTVAVASRATPRLADFDSDGTADVLVRDAAGEILWRRGRTQVPGTFDPPIVINPGAPARDFAVVATARGPLIAAVDARGESVSLYARHPLGGWVGPFPSGFDPATYVPPSGGFVREATLPTGVAPARIVSGDLDGDGWLDLAVLNAVDGSVSLFRGDGRGGFRTAATVPVGLGASGLTLADTDGSGLPDLVLTNQVEGDVRVLPNRGDFTFAPMGRYHAGTGLYGVRRDEEDTTLTTAEATSGLAVGVFTRDGPTGLVALNRGSRSLAMLAGLPGGGLADPGRLAASGTPEDVTAADLNRDGLDDLAVLSPGGVQVLLADGAGGFRPAWAGTAGPGTTGLSAADVDGDGLLDLVVGNDFGDVLVLVGNGDGTFKRFQPREAAIALAVADLDGDGRDDFVFANTALERVSVEYGARGPDFAATKVVRDRSDGLLGPEAVQLADLDGDGVKDLVVANGGGNAILVYRGLGDGQFGAPAGGPGGFTVGTNPTGFTISDLNGDGRPDLLVANSGSNDVSVLLGRDSGAGWTMTPGPRIKTDAGPVAVAAGDILGTGKIDLAVANRQANDVQVFPGLGGGFFNDQQPRTYAVGQAPGGLFLGNFDGAGTEVAALNAGSNTVSLIGPGGVIGSYAVGGQRPVSGFAGDFNGDGLTDLVVGNARDGRLALLLGGPGGLSLSQTLSSPEAPAPTALSFAGLSDGLLSFYVASAGREAAVGLAFDLATGSGAEGPGAGVAIVTALGPSAAALAQAAVALVQPVGQLLSFNGTALDLVTTLLSVATVAGPAEAEAGGAGEAVALVASFQPAPGGGPGQGTGAAQAEGGHADDEPGGPPEEAPGLAAEAGMRALPAWARLAVGLARAWERARAEELERAGRPQADPRHRVAIPPPREPAGPRPRAATGSHAGPAADTGPPAAPLPIAAPEGGAPRHRAAEVIDAALGHLASGPGTRPRSIRRAEALAATALLALAVGAERVGRRAGRHRPRVPAAMSPPTSRTHPHGPGMAHGR